MIHSIAISYINDDLGQLYGNLLFFNQMECEISSRCVRRSQ